MSPGRVLETTPTRDARELLLGLSDRLAGTPTLTGALDRARAGETVRMGNLVGSSPGLVGAAVCRAADTGVLLVTAGLEESLDLAEDLAAFLGRREGEDGADPVRTVEELPAWETSPGDDSPPSPRVLRHRLAVLHAVVEGEVPAVVAGVSALLQPVPPPSAVRDAVLRLATGDVRPPEALHRDLVEAGFCPVPMVTGPGEVARRGGILDVFPLTADTPVRLEFFGDEVDSIRVFDPESQRSIAPVDEVALQAIDPRRVHLAGDEGTFLVDHLPADVPVLVLEPDAVEKRARELSRGLGKEAHGEPAALWRSVDRRARLELSALPFGAPDEIELDVGGVSRATGDLDAVVLGIGEIADEVERVRVLCRREAEVRRLTVLLEERGVVVGEEVDLRRGWIHRGFVCRDLGVALLTEHELLERHEPRRDADSAPTVQGDPIRSFLDLDRGDLVVHARHGIGRFEGLETLEEDGRPREYLKLTYAKRSALYVPADRIDLVQKYVGAGGKTPSLDTLGGTRFEKRRERARKAAEELAAELLRVHAAREANPGFAYPADDPWVAELEASFPYTETPDQARIARSIREDMEAERPMDRLICGDVGYGKTELAVRAAFKAAVAGKQVAVLVPTTVLCQQHLRTFRDRMAGYPVHIAPLSRFETAAEQRETIRGIREGTIEVCIGTHRLLSDDVEWKDLGLVIVDEEQRFGVKQKMALTKLRTSVDVLTLSATPIPRTLHMALAGIRDISTMDTAPRGRLAIETQVARPTSELIREAIVRELARDGQVFFVHNRVRSIEKRATEIERIVPEARVLRAHGQMEGRRLEERMGRFLDGRADVLCTTTIIESGVDIPRVNTIIIDRADRFGLADLHQLRGRVGRSRHRAYCYLLLPEQGTVTDPAKERLRAIEEFDELGAGFRIALRDLEIRGAGNLLGPEQSGHITGVGYEMYCQLLKRAVRRQRGETELDPVDRPLEIGLELPLAIPDDYVPDPAQKLELYRTLTRAASPAEIEDVRDEMEDRFGAPPPRAVLTLLEASEMRVRLRELGVRRIRRLRKMAILELHDGVDTGPLAEVAGERFRPIAEDEVHVRLPDDRTTERGALEILLDLTRAAGVAEG